MVLWTALFSQQLPPMGSVSNWLGTRQAKSFRSVALTQRPSREDFPIESIAHPPARHAARTWLRGAWGHTGLLCRSVLAPWSR